MKRHTWLIRLATACFSLVLLPPLTLIFIPDVVVQQAISRILSSRGITIQAAHIGTSFPFGITATNVILSDSTTHWLTFDHISAQLRLLPLLTGKASVTVTGAVGQGRLSGICTLWPQTYVDLEATNLELANIPLLATATSGTVKGTAHIELTLHSSTQSSISGNARFMIRSAQLQGVHISNLSLPDMSFPELRGLIKIKGQTVNIDNLALQGDGIYIRLSGTTSLTQGYPLSLSLELLPSAELLTQQKSAFQMLSPYQVSAGSYKLPITGTLTSPQLAPPTEKQVLSK